MKKKTIYSYTDSGDLVHCNQCETDMLVPTGADKCPHCYFEGALGWLDEQDKETSVSNLDLNPDYILVTENAPEPTEYLSDETLRDEFDMLPNPKHMARHLCYHLNKQEDSTIYLFDIEKPKNKDEIQENIVSSFFFYMWNAWSKQECETVFGWEYRHFLDKWDGICKRHSVLAAAERFYAELSTNNRVKLVKRACEMYDGSRRRE